MCFYNLVLLNDEEDERSSVYSHPSMLDGGVNFAVKPNYSPLLASTPENSFLNDSVFLAPTEELSSEVSFKYL